MPMPSTRCKQTLLLALSGLLLCVHWRGVMPRAITPVLFAPAPAAWRRDISHTTAGALPFIPHAAGTHPNEGGARAVCSAPPPSQLAGVAVHHIQEHAPECPTVVAWRAGRSQLLAPEAPFEAVADPILPVPAAADSEGRVTAPRYDAVQLRFTEIQAAAEPLAVGVQLAEVRLFYGRRRLSIASANAVDPDGPTAHNASNAADGLLFTKWLDSALLGRRGRSAGLNWRLTTWPKSPPGLSEGRGCTSSLQSAAQATEAP